MVSAVSNESHATPSYRALGVVKDLGNPPDESAAVLKTTGVLAYPDNN